MKLHEQLHEIIEKADRDQIYFKEQMTNDLKELVGDVQLIEMTVEGQAKTLVEMQSNQPTGVQTSIIQNSEIDNSIRMECLKTAASLSEPNGEYESRRPLSAGGRIEAADKFYAYITGVADVSKSNK